MRYVTLCLFFCLSVVASAQVQKGDRLLRLDRSPLGNVTLPGDFSTALVYGDVTYGFALSDRFVLGATLTASQGIGPGSFGFIGLTPYLRYYAINRERLGVYGQVGSGLQYSRKSVTGFSSALATAGLQLPIATGVRFGPTVSYSFDKNNNAVVLGSTLEVVLGRNTRPEDAVVADFHRGSIMLGGHTASATFSKGASSGRLSLGGYYFLTDRLAAAVTVGANGYRDDFDSQRLSIKNRLASYYLSVGSRYYLSTDRRLLWFGEAAVGYQWSRRLYAFNSDSERTISDGMGLSVSGGAQLFVRENVAFEVGPFWSRSFTGDNEKGYVGLNLGGRFLLR